jgi:hypothetical protein
MSYHSECHGRVRLGNLPERVRDRLVSLPGEWLEYDPVSNAIIVSHVEPTESPVLETVASELVQILAEVPFDLHEGIEGGVFFVHREEAGQLVRLRVDGGGALHIQWAHPDYAGSARRPYTGRHEIAIDSWEHRLNGTATFGIAAPATAAERLRDLAAGFEGLYPEGELSVGSKDEGTAELVLRDVNLDAALLVEHLLELAEPRTLDGGIEVSSFGEIPPENHVRLTFDAGEVWVQHPLLWADSPDGD